jgi:hypothetical protein
MGHLSFIGIDFPAIFRLGGLYRLAPERPAESGWPIPPEQMAMLFDAQVKIVR